MPNNDFSDYTTNRTSNGSKNETSNKSSNVNKASNANNTNNANNANKNGYMYIAQFVVTEQYINVPIVLRITKRNACGELIIKFQNNSTTDPNLEIFRYKNKALTCVNALFSDTLFVL